MDAVQDSKTPGADNKKGKASSTYEKPVSEPTDKALVLPEQSGNHREADLFQELRQRKLKEPPHWDPVSTEKSAEKVAASVPVWMHWTMAALIGGVISFIFLNFQKKDVEKPNKPVATVLNQPVSEAPLVSETQVATVTGSLKSKHNARIWDSEIPASRRTNPFSIEVSDAFLLDYSRPVLVRGTLLDIAHGSRGIEVTFSLPKIRGEIRDVLVLGCSAEQLELFIGGIKGISEYAVVANCYETQNDANGFSIMGRLIDAGNFFKVEKKHHIARNP